jgi:hypothetical protein
MAQKYYSRGFTLSAAGPCVTDWLESVRVAGELGVTVSERV